MVDTGFGCQAVPCASEEPGLSHRGISVGQSRGSIKKKHGLLVGACLFFLIAAAGRAFPSPPPVI